ncbi:NADH-quinone oxidoreductase subunit D [Salsipaludibacter albus]|uniref:NADH-quinone oxidoreductase subunit D n=1 Tax=Salsipaludibacter albus TaxID=2849650 RepID=UPI001EE4BF4F|nr:NADH-quinone oxidoreductase subunit D [Salsipaludibacter albus]MBY5161030.1 NADH-quinone oxidoreductase subunit D [Salsipaludibacter albus]
MSDLDTSEKILPGTAPAEDVIFQLEGDADFDTGEMSLSIGPAHPATHGVLRVVLDMDGERIREARPVIGYMHRGFEKLAEYRDYRQIMALTNRHDWLSGFCNELGVALAVEKMMEMEVPDRAQWIRMLLAEWNRVLNHLMFIGSYALELGAITPMFYAFREREDIQFLLESATGGRLHFTYNQPGGVKIDLPKGFLRESARLVDETRSRLSDYVDLVLGNEIFQARTKGIGALPPEVALAYGVTGPTLQATGVPEDSRVTEPYLKYGEIDVRVPTGDNGDSFDRFAVLLGRVEASLEVIDQIHDHIGPGPVNTKLPKMVKAPEGFTYVRTENPLGQLGYYLHSDGSKNPWRFKMRTPSFSNVQVLPYLLEGQLMPDAVAILGSVFFVVGDVDR